MKSFTRPSELENNYTLTLAGLQKLSSGNIMLKGKTLASDNIHIEPEKEYSIIFPRQFIIPKLQSNRQYQF